MLRNPSICLVGCASLHPRGQSRLASRELGSVAVVTGPIVTKCYAPWVNAAMILSIRICTDRCPPNVHVSPPSG